VAPLRGLSVLLLASGCAHAPADLRSGAELEAPPPHTRGSVVERATRRSPPEALEAPPAAEVSLPEILTWADRHSPLLLVARSTRSRVDAARAVASVLQPSNPEVTFAAGPRFGISGTGVDLEAGVSQQLQIAGERGLRQGAAQRLSELTDAEIEQIRWAVHSEVHALFHRALVEQERVRLAGQVAEFQTEVFRVVGRQAHAGETAPLTTRLAQAEVAQAGQALVGARQGHNVALLRLARVAGWPPDALPTLRGTLDAPRDPPTLGELNDAAEQYTPELRRREAAVREAASRVALADREAWPRPSVGVQYRREGNPTSEGAYDIVLGTLSVPIPGFQRNQGERARARAELEVARAELAAARMQLRVQVAEAYSEMVAAAQRTRAYGTEILPRFAENLALLRRSFEVGEIDMLALSVGRERFLRIQSDAIAAQLDYFVAMAALERIVGIELWRDEHAEGEQP
jgi:outer membrane protein, heavy metal efflux system